MTNGFKEQYNPPKSVIDNLKLLADNILEPIRDRYGAFAVTCAYRCPRVNKAVGGASNSEHLYGKAIDETFIDGGKNVCNDVANWLIYDSGLKWSKLILEYPFKDTDGRINYRWLHIGYDTDNLKNEILIAKKSKEGKVIYEVFKKN
ncbi:MAG TPA: D-Ala-D-Ala carboxypeptidase family metallohydrolase, partial [Cytophagales bacterium]|nr:D-Ala-D-Ala carboxypeptidase family metallohydrolase [Cytophagales bacterium]